jgi:hypothetical protein
MDGPPQALLPPGNLSPSPVPRPYCPDRRPAERARMITGIVRGLAGGVRDGASSGGAPARTALRTAGPSPITRGCGTVRLSAFGREEPAATDRPCGSRAEGLLKTPRGMPEANRMTLNRRVVRLRRPVACSIPSARSGARPRPHGRVSAAAGASVPVRGLLPGDGAEAASGRAAARRR